MRPESQRENTTDRDRPRELQRLRLARARRDERRDQGEHFQVGGYGPEGIGNDVLVEVCVKPVCKSYFTARSPYESFGAIFENIFMSLEDDFVLPDPSEVAAAEAAARDSFAVEPPSPPTAGRARKGKKGGKKKRH